MPIPVIERPIATVERTTPIAATALHLAECPQCAFIVSCRSFRRGLQWIAAHVRAVHPKDAA